jgi:hypothetical protein
LPDPACPDSVASIDVAPDDTRDHPELADMDLANHSRGTGWLGLVFALA